MAGGFFPEGFFPEGHFPDGHFPEAAGGVSPPHQFYFETKFNATPSTQYVSSTAIISGLVVEAESVVTGGEQSVNGEAFTSNPVNIDNGDELRIRQTASADPETQNIATATIAGIIGDFVTVTGESTAARTSWRRRAFIVPTRRVA